METRKAIRLYVDSGHPSFAYEDALCPMLPLARAAEAYERQNGTRHFGKTVLRIH